MRGRKVAILVIISRYRCLNPECPRRTFPVLPPLVLRYSRFFWPCLLALKMSLDQGLTPYHRFDNQRRGMLLNGLSNVKIKKVTFIW
jgi:hypothetical protein